MSYKILIDGSMGFKDAFQYVILKGVKFVEQKEIDSLKAQLAEKDQLIAEAGQLLNWSTNIITYLDNKTLEDHTFYLDSAEKWLTKDINQGVVG